MTARASDPRYVLDQYEALRREATELTPCGPRGHGLALFLSRGLPAWLAALTALASAEPTRPPAERSPVGGPRLLPSTRAELTTVLAGMVLACTQEGEEP